MFWFWFLCALLTLAVGVVIAVPLRRGHGPAAAPSAAAFDLRVYRDQLREVERDLERGVIAEAEAARLRTEIGRKVLDADRRLSEAGPMVRGGAMAGAAAVLVLALASAVLLYLREGVPGAPDLPVAARIASAQRLYENRPHQAEAEARAPQQPPAEADPDYLALVEKLREAVARKPEDPQGLRLLATSEMRLGNSIAAREVQQKLVALLGDKAGAADLFQLSALMAEAAGGLITPESEAVLARALQMDPRLPQGRYLLGMLQLQNGRPDRAFPLWRDLLEEGPADAPWVQAIRPAIRDLAWLAGQPDYIPPEPAVSGMPALPGPDADQMQAAEEMSIEERQQMVAGMVSRLEARLAEQGGTPEEWARLIGALGVLGQTERAQAIWAEAQQHFGDRPEAMAAIRAAAEQAGLIE